LSSATHQRIGPATHGRSPATSDDERGYGWVAFAGTLLLILGPLNFIEGLAAINNAHFFVANTHYIAGSLNTWGWVVLCIGVLVTVDLHARHPRALRSDRVRQADLQRRLSHGDTARRSAPK
jgi:hypothetical protein